MSRFFINEHGEAQGSLSYRTNVLMGNSISAIVAGSDTTRAALIAIWYYLIKHPSHMTALREELSGIDINRDVNKLAGLPHLNAVIKETLRLAPPAMTGSSRITGDEGLWVDDVWIPGRTKVTSPKYVVQRCKSDFADARTFPHPPRLHITYMKSS
jgi:cytochrome P450